MKKTGSTENGDEFEESNEIMFFKEPYLDDKYSFSFDNAVFSNASNNDKIYGNNYVNRVIISAPNNDLIILVLLCATVPVLLGLLLVLIS